MLDGGGAPRAHARTLVNLDALRVAPATTATQRGDDFGVRVEPDARLHRHVDYFGTTVIEFGIPRPHDRLSIDVRARVRTAAPEEPPEAPWIDLEAAPYRAEAGEFLLATTSRTTWRSTSWWGSPARRRRWRRSGGWSR
jgi:hypothetical protein